MNWNDLENQISLQSAIELHESSKNWPEALENCFLDGHFLKISPIARKVRAAFLKENFSFEIISENKLQDLFYQKFIFLLPYQKRKEKLYYYDTSSAVYAVQQKLPHALKQPAAKVLATYLSSKLLHESLHLLNFKHFFSNKWPYEYNQNFTESQERNWVLSHVTIEACVLSLEVMSTLVKPEPNNLFTTRWSCHQMASYPKEYLVLENAIAKLGLAQTFECLLKTFLAINLRPLAKSLTAEEVNLVFPDALQSKEMLELIKRGQKLGDGFRNYSNTRYFTSLGLIKKYTDVVSDFKLDEVLGLEIVKDITNYNFSKYI
jgi:hypothetical protein